MGYLPSTPIMSPLPWGALGQFNQSSILLAWFLSRSRRLDQAGGGEAPESEPDGGGNPCPSTGVDLGPGAVTALAQVSLKKEQSARLFHFFISMSPVRVSPLPALKVGGGEG